MAEALLSQGKDQLLLLVNSSASKAEQLWQLLVKRLQTGTLFEKCLILGSASFLSYFFVIHPISSHLYRKMKRYPPGLIGVPYFGSLFTMIFYGEPNFSHKLLPKYGGLTMYKIGQTNMLLLNDVNILKAVQGSDCCIDRPWQMSKIFHGYGSGVCPFVFGNEEWQNRRKLFKQATTIISNQSFIETQLLNILNSKVYPRLDATIANDNSRWYPTVDLFGIGFNVTFGALFGYNDYYLDPYSDEFKTVMEGLEGFGKALGLSIVANLFYIPNIFGLRDKIERDMTAAFGEPFAKWEAVVSKYYRMCVDSYKKDNNSINNTILYELLKELPNYPTITQDMFESDCIELIGAATDTTATAFEACIKYAATYRELQEELFDELKQHSIKSESDSDGSGYRYELIASDFNKCVKFRAFINEVMRAGCEVPKGVSRSLTHDCVLKFNTNKKTGRAYDVLFEKMGANDKNSGKMYDYEYVIDRSFYIEGNFLYIMTEDSTIWGDNASQFDINHWIENKVGKDKNKIQKFVNRPESNIFGFGRRTCPGQIMARKSLRIIIGNLFLNYKFEFEDEKNENNMKFQHGFTQTIHPKVPLIVTKR